MRLLTSQIVPSGEKNPALPLQPGDTVFLGPRAQSVNGVITSGES